MGQARPTRFKTAKAPPSALKLPRPSRWLSSLMSNSATPSFVARWGSLDTPRTAEPPAEGLDSFDVAILEILQRENTTPLQDHRPSCESVGRQRRVKRMREDGTIVGNIAVVDPARLGRAITIWSRLSLRASGPTRSKLCERASWLLLKYSNVTKSRAKLILWWSSPSRRCKITRPQPVGCSL